MQPQTDSLGEKITAKRQLLRQQLAGAFLGRPQPQLTRMLANTATTLLPLLAVLDAVQAQATNESVFHSRRLKIQMHLAVAYAELYATRPRRQALRYTFRVLAELMREEVSDISPDELKQAAKEVALATLRNAPALLNVAHQARLLA